MFASKTAPTSILIFRSMAYSKKPDYALLSDGDPENMEFPGAPRYSQQRESLCSMIVQILTFFLAAIILTTQIWSPKASPATSSVLPEGVNRVNPTIPHQLKPCGTTAEEARANGCIFDLLTLAWLAPACYEKDLSEEFLEVASEPFYYDIEGKHQIENYEILSERTEPSWTTRRYHIYHCSYGWRLMHKMIEQGRMLESGLSSYHHTEHCTDTLMNQTVPMEDVITRIIIMYPDC